MSYKSELIQVQVSRRVLWVGSQAYPLQNIARASTLETVINRGAAIWSFVKAFLTWGILGVVVSAALSAGGDETSGYVTWVVAIVLAILAYKAFLLIRVLSTPTLYSLVIETAGSPNHALTSDDRDLVIRIVHDIMDAIDNAEAAFTYNVKHYHGDVIKQIGNNNVGKKATT
ncbi:DUF6232 family protein [Streptomyces sp. NPDC051217]|uniref:DUF6232 family protein n=1 Tax=Streptomyces sp. NPDC051217 TaxID=3365644 RepID=UPI003787D1E1